MVVINYQFYRDVWYVDAHMDVLTVCIIKALILWKVTQFKQISYWIFNMKPRDTGTVLLLAALCYFTATGKILSANIIIINLISCVSLQHIYDEKVRRHYTNNTIPLTKWFYIFSGYILRHYVMGQFYIKFAGLALETCQEREIPPPPHIGISINIFLFTN